MNQTTKDTRRRFLKVIGGTVGLVGLAGCSTLPGGSDSSPTDNGTGPSPTTVDGTDGPRDAVVNMEVRADDPSDTDVVFQELPEVEKDIVRTAQNQDFYHVCSDIPGEVQSFASRFDEAQFLAYESERYGVWIRIGDVVFVDTASAPNNTPDCT